ncbi:MAG: hypothetical protein JRG93_11095, partial [Deltaproteobacteria bacterium]|nr:hypothetical protein [Deltaproteobacteria bacterium]
NPKTDTPSDPFAETRKKIRSFLKERGIPDEHADVFEPYAMAAVAFACENPPDKVLENHPRLVGLAGLTLVGFGAFLTFAAVKKLRKKQPLKAV